ncbi:MAG: ring-cleaving dioxygenase [Mucilaginibacter polytrichastri]|nr:ring-cleaving dioxygenase [Mucilaginibacter polytrichastri]
MEKHIAGLHHITAIAGNAQRNVGFYRDLLGLRLVKKTVNFDDPNTYHLYYGDEQGTPGTILTFFPWENIMTGRRGSRQVTEIGYAVPEKSLEFWLQRFKERNIIYNNIGEKFGRPYLTFLDPDGLKLELIAADEDTRSPWLHDKMTGENGLRGFFNVTITANELKPTADILTDVFGYRLEQEHVNRYRFTTDAVPDANVIDVVEALGEKPGHVAGGSVHHVAFRVKDEETLMQYRDKILSLGLHITEKIDRNYFYSLYFREPGGVLFEIATDNPGFTVDEPLDELGTHLKLPAQYESHRSEIEKNLPKIA